MIWLLLILICLRLILLIYVWVLQLVSDDSTEIQSTAKSILYDLGSLIYSDVERMETAWTSSKNWVPASVALCSRHTGQGNGEEAVYFKFKYIISIYHTRSGMNTVGIGSGFISYLGICPEVAIAFSYSTVYYRLYRVVHEDTLHKRISYKSALLWNDIGYPLNDLHQNYCQVSAF